MKKVGENLYKLVEICVASQPLIFDKIMAGDVHAIKDGFRAYNNYMCSMNLLVGLISEWRFKSKLPDPKAVLESCMEHFQILVSALDELAKKYDYLVVETTGSVKSLKDLKTFIENESHALSNVQIHTDTIQGAHEYTPKYRKQLRSLNRLPNKIHKYKLGSDVYIGGAESVQTLKERILKLKNLKADISDTKITSDPSYYENVFLPTVGKIIDCEPDDVETELQNGVSIDVKSDDQMDLVISDLPKLSEYCSMRTGKNYEFPEVSKDLAGIAELLQSLVQFMQVIHAEDHRVITENLRVLSEQDVSDNYLLLSGDFHATARREYKLRHKKLCEELQSLLSHNSKPNPTNSNSENLVIVKHMPAEIQARAQAILSALQNALQTQAAALDHTQTQELVFNSAVTLLKQIVDNILAMIEPSNKQTCIRRTCLLINTLMSAPENIQAEIKKLYPTDWKPGDSVNLLLSSYF